MKVKSILAAVVVVAGAFAGAAQASPTWTMTAKGTIDSGFDYTGVFGTAGQNLAGLAFMETITVSTDPTQYTSRTTTDYYDDLYGNIRSFTEAVTVNGEAVSYTVSQPLYGEQYIADGATKYGGGTYSDEAYTYEYGYDALGEYLYGSMYTTTTDGSVGLVPMLDFSQTINGDNPSVSNYVGFFVSTNGYTDAAITAYPTSFTVNGTDVPEPASIALLGLGFAVMGSLRRRKSS